MIFLQSNSIKIVILADHQVIMVDFYGQITLITIPTSTPSTFTHTTTRIILPQPSPPSYQNNHHSQKTTHICPTLPPNSPTTTQYHHHYHHLHYQPLTISCPPKSCHHQPSITNPHYLHTHHQHPSTSTTITTTPPAYTTQHHSTSASITITTITSGELFVEGVSAKVDMHWLNTAFILKFKRRQICLV